MAVYHQKSYSWKDLSGQQGITIGLWELWRLPSVMMSLALETSFLKFPKIVSSFPFKGWSWPSWPVLIYHTGPPWPQGRTQALDRAGLPIQWIRWHPGWHLACSMPVLPHWKGIATAKQQIPSISADTCISATTWFVSATPYCLFSGLASVLLKMIYNSSIITFCCGDFCNKVWLKLLSKACFIIVKNTQCCSKFSKSLQKWVASGIWICAVR